MSGKKVAALVVVGVLVLSAVVLVVASLGASLRTGRPVVAVIHLDGPIQESAGTGLTGPVITPTAVRQRLRSVEADPRIVAVVVRLQTPGGAVAASQQIADAFADLDKPVVVSMADVAASGGYYISTGADRIVAHPGTLTGSIGVLWVFLDLDGLLDELGVELEAVTAGEHKDMFLPGRLTPERRALVQALVDDAYDQFVGAVAAGRGLSEAEVRELATGQLYSGTQALALGLVDRLGGIDEAIEEAERLAGVADAEVVELRPSLLEQLFGPGLGVRFGLPLRSPTDLPLGELAQLRDLLHGLTGPRYEIP